MILIIANAVYKHYDRKLKSNNMRRQKIYKYVETKQHILRSKEEIKGNQEYIEINENGNTTY